jgi:hypothetical protein
MEVHFWNFAEVGFFSELVLLPRNSTEFLVQNSAGFGGKTTRIPKDIPELLYFGDKETWRHGDRETWKHGDVDMDIAGHR